MYIILVSIDFSTILRMVPFLSPILTVTSVLNTGETGDTNTAINSTHERGTKCTDFSLWMLVHQ